jgi:hypothetical protein
MHPVDRPIAHNASVTASTRHETAAHSVSVQTVQVTLAGVLAALCLVSLDQGSDGARRLGLGAGAGTGLATAVLAGAATFAVVLAVLIAVPRTRPAAGVGLAVLMTAAAVGALVGWAHDAPAACGCVAGVRQDSAAAHVVASFFLAACAVVAWIAVARVSARRPEGCRNRERSTSTTR